jgi:hypothetical protein
MASSQGVSGAAGARGSVRHSVLRLVALIFCFAISLLVLSNRQHEEQAGTQPQAAAVAAAPQVVAPSAPALADLDVGGTGWQDWAGRSMDRASQALYRAGIVASAVFMAIVAFVWNSALSLSDYAFTQLVGAICGQQSEAYYMVRDQEGPLGWLVGSVAAALVGLLVVLVSVPVTTSLRSWRAHR